MPDEHSAEDRDFFTIGLTMAGAVSAGAYTAGVIDVLFRALDEHNARAEERRKAEAAGQAPPDSDAPRHKVVLKAMSGASAGGVSIGLGAVSLIRRNEAGRLGRPISTPGAGMADRTEPPYAYSYVLDTVHDVWVEKLDLWHNQKRGFLTTGDLEDRRTARSVLNSWHLDDEGQQAMTGIGWPDGARPYDFMADQLELFLTTTNLMGVPYAVEFTGQRETPGARRAGTAHTMAQHSVARHFRLEGLGSARVPSAWLEAWRDYGIMMKMPAPGSQIDFSEPVADPDGRISLPTPWAAFRQASIATGAFPGGFSARLLRAQVKDYGISIKAGEQLEPIQGGAWLIEEKPDEVARSRAFGGIFEDEQWEHEVPYIAVDGGVANNEPFEFARFTLRKPAPAGATPYLERNPRDLRHADRAVIMIDPFPEGPEFAVPDIAGDEAHEMGLVTNLLRLPSALINQARFKPSALLLAKSESVASRFLIAPSRDVVDAEQAETRLTGSAAIASGALGGFLGFFDRDFRAHDFMLGQHNCHSFLDKHFVLDPENPVLRLSAVEREAWSRRVRKEGLKGVPVLRPLGDADRPAGGWPEQRLPFPQPRWPRMRLEKLKTIQREGVNRLGAVADSLIRDKSPERAIRLAISLLWQRLKLHLKDRLTRIVLAEMILRDQIDAFAHLDRDGRVVLATLARIGSDGATARQIAERIEGQNAKCAKMTNGASPPAIGEAGVQRILDAETVRGRKDEDRAVLWQPRDGKGPYALSLNRPWMIGRARHWIGSFF